MTLPPSLSELDSESNDDHELGRITVLVGGLLIDVAVPTRVNTSAIVNDVIELANDRLIVGATQHVKFDNSEGKWAFTRLTGDTVDRGRSLAEAGVYDGELLVVGEAGAPPSSSLADKLDGMTETVDTHGRWFAEQRWMAGWFVLSITLSVVTALLLPHVAVAPQVVGMPVAAVTVLVVGIGCAVAAFVMQFRPGDPRKAVWLAGSALPLIFGGSLRVVPDAHGANTLSMALALTALVALLQLLGTNPRAVGAILATVAVIVVYLAPRATIMLSGLPMPRVPTAGEPLDDIETQGGTAVEGVNAIGKQLIPTEEGMINQVRRAREYLTGMVAAAAILAAAGCYFALDVEHGFFWQGVVFGFAVATVLCLRGRSHHDVIQSGVLIGGGLVIALVIIVKTAAFVDGWQVKTAVALVVLTALLVACGLVAPRREFSPVMRRRVEILEYLAIGLVFPLACWIIRLYVVFREMRV
jgi:hypothetical protein